MFEGLKQLFAFTKPAPLEISSGQMAFWCERELTDLADDLMAVFEVREHCRDYENEWEWIEGSSAQGIYVNVSRPHDWAKGEYGCPILIFVKRHNERVCGDGLLPFAERLATRFVCDVHIGKLGDRKAPPTCYEFKSRKIVKYKAAEPGATDNPDDPQRI